MVTLGEQKANHGISNQHDLCRLSVHCGCPVSVLGNGGVEHSVPVAVNSTFNMCIFEGKQLQSGCVQNIIGFPEKFLVEHTAIDSNSAVFVALAGKVDLNHIAPYHISDGLHLRDAVGRAVKLQTVFLD